MENHKPENSFAPASEYYNRIVRRFSLMPPSNKHLDTNLMPSHVRRGSKDDRSTTSQRFLVDIAKIKSAILKQEDTDGNFQITIHDKGPKIMRIPTFGSGGNKTFEVRGTYMLSNLLQEMALAEDLGKKFIVIDEERLNENPVDRLYRMITTLFWSNLTRVMDFDGIQASLEDPKDNIQPLSLVNTTTATATATDTATATAKPNYIYVPFGDDYAFDYYSEMSKAHDSLAIKVVKLPKNITPKYVKSLNGKFGILTLAAKLGSVGTGNYGRDKRSYEPLPFIVPGGRFNEMYGWDSYFESLGVLKSNRMDLAKAMVDHFVYQITHYGKILNANRSYYLTRSHPPFLTDLLRKVYDQLPSTPENLKWLENGVAAAIKEYKQVWMSSPRYDAETGLSTYHPTGIGKPPETEEGHYDHIFKPYAQSLGVTINEYIDLYASDKIKEPELDEYFTHDRAVRESGHDTSYRVENKCADLATVDLNSLLYLYEVDIAYLVKSHLKGSFEVEGELHYSAAWIDRANKRRERIDHFLWCEESGMYYDYNIKTRSRENFESVTTLFPLFAQCASEHQAWLLALKAIPLFEETGGLVSTTLESRGPLSKSRPSKQWDYPYGWAPHQILVWDGLKKYGYTAIAERLAYRWLYTIVLSYNDHNGVVPEKFDVVDISHQVDVEYGNVGTDFKMVSKCGFGWMNTSFVLGLDYIDFRLRRALGSLISPEKLFSKEEHIEGFETENCNIIVKDGYHSNSDSQGYTSDSTVVNYLAQINKENPPLILLNDTDEINDNILSSLDINKDQIMAATSGTPKLDQ